MGGQDPGAGQAPWRSEALMGEPDESGFMLFAEGWNQTAKGWYHEAAGAAEGGVDGLLGDEGGAAEGAIEAAEGHAQAERGKNLMGDGVSEMLGLVDHGSPGLAMPDPPPDEGPDPGYDDGGVPDGGDLDAGRPGGT